jgi:hypothetical protein
VTTDGVWIGNMIYWTLKHITRDYTLQITIAQRLVSSVTLFTSLLSRGFQRRTFPFFCVLEPSLASAANFSLLKTCNSQLTVCVQNLSRLTGKGCSSSLYILGTNRKENTASTSPSIVARVPIAAIIWRLLNHCLTTGLSAAVTHNGYLCWLHNSGFQQTCHNIVEDTS